MGSKKYKFAVAGYGYIGKRHAGIIEEHPDCELLAICEPQPIESTQYPVFNSVEQLLDSDLDFDVLAIAGPNNTHAELANLGLKAKKHVIIEKPMTLSKLDAQKIIDLSLKVNRKVFCVMQNRYSPPAHWLKSVVMDGKLGKIYMLNISCYWNRDNRYYLPPTWKGKLKTDGGTLFTQFSHFVDILYWIFGDIENIQAKFRDFNHQNTTEFEDSGIISFDLLNGGMGTMTYSSSVWDKNMESSLTVIAEHGSIKIGGQYMNKLEYCHVKDLNVPELADTTPANQYNGFQGSANNHLQFYQNVVDALNGKPSLTSNAEEGMKVVEIIERIYQNNPYFKEI